MDYAEIGIFVDGWMWNQADNEPEEPTLEIVALPEEDYFGAQQEIKLTEW